MKLLRCAATVAIGAWIVSLPAAARPQTGSTARVSLTSEGMQAEGRNRPFVSADGRWVVFTAVYFPFVTGAPGGVLGIFVHDRQSGETECVSIDPSGNVANGESVGPTLSADGRYVAFRSQATNLVPGNPGMDIYVRDRQSGAISRVSVDSAGTQGNQASLGAFISADGRFVVFESLASNLVPGDTNGWKDVFVHDRQSAQTTRVSVDSAGNEANETSYVGPISNDGRYVAFFSRASNLVVGDTNNCMDVFVHDRQTGSTRRVSVDSAGAQGDLSSGAVSISADGQLVAFQSQATNLVPGDTNGVEDVFVHDMQSGETTRASVNSLGVQGNFLSQEPALSPDGRYVAFSSSATNFVPGDTNNWADIYVHDRQTGEIFRASVSTSGSQASGQSDKPSLSADNRFVAFQSYASDLVPWDTNNVTDIFVRDVIGCSPTIATYCTASTTSIPGCQAAISGVGTPSLSSPTAFKLTSGAVPGGILGICYFGTHNPAATPFGTQGGFICVGIPTVRSAAKLAGGTPGSCSGQLEFRLQDLIALHPGFIKVGSTVHAAIWFRDSASADGYGLSNALWFDVCQ